MERKATAQWLGDLKTGKGQLSTDSGALAYAPYDSKMRFENEKGTNPEELIAAAHASCFTMALSAELQKIKLTAKRLDVEASVNLEKGEQWTINAVHLKVSADVPGASQNQFQQAAETAKANCPVSRLLKAEITMETQLGTQPVDMTV